MNKCLKCGCIAMNNDVKNNQEILLYFKQHPNTNKNICRCNSIKL